VTSKHRTFVYMTLFVLLLLSPARAQAPRESVREVMTFTGTIDRIDRFSRALTIRTDNSLTQTVYVEPSVKLFDQLKSGDKVRVRVQESVIVALRPGAKPTEVTDTTEEARRQTAPGQPDVLQQLKAIVTIESIDISKQLVVYTAGDNRRVARAVADARLLQGLKRGDVIEITYTRDRAVEVERQR